jgi:Zn-dependent protease with chaperone function
MSPLVQSVQLFVLAGVLFLLLGAALSAFILQVVKKRLLAWAPYTRHRALLLLALLPIFSALCLLLSVSLPSALALVFPAFDHCLVHAGHLHLCFVHLPAHELNLPLHLALVLIVSYAGARVLIFGAGVLRASRVLDALARTGLRRNDLDVVVLETPAPICFAAGLWRPQVLISRGLLRWLDTAQRAIVLAHERAHVRRHDALIMSLVRVCALWHFPRVARWLVRELEIAAEQVCDEEAATIVGDRIAVAEAILSVERAAQAQPTVALVPNTSAVAFGERAIERRVESLLRDPQPTLSLLPVYAGLCASAATLVWFANGLHHATESVLSVIAR